MFSVDSSTAPGSALTRNRKFLIAGVSILSGIVLLCGIGYFALRNTNPKPPNTPGPEPVAELVSSNGMVLVRPAGKSEWREVKTGAWFMEGDLVQTDSSGEAGIRYKSGSTVSIPEKTVLTIQRAANDRIEISVPPDAAGFPPLLMAEEDGGAESRESRPFIELHQIIPFGRSLELIGRVEPGSSLAIDNETVEVTGDGSFKHFTKPFPASAGLVSMRLKVMDLAGRTRIWTTTHEFSRNGRNK